MMKAHGRGMAQEEPGGELLDFEELWCCRAEGPNHAQANCRLRWPTSQPALLAVPVDPPKRSAALPKTCNTLVQLQSKERLRKMENSKGKRRRIGESPLDHDVAEARRLAAEQRLSSVSLESVQWHPDTTVSQSYAEPMLPLKGQQTVVHQPYGRWTLKARDQGNANWFAEDPRAQRPGGYVASIVVTAESTAALDNTICERARVLGKPHCLIRLQFQDLPPQDGARQVVDGTLATGPHKAAPVGPAWDIHGLYNAEQHETKNRPLLSLQPDPQSAPQAKREMAADRDEDRPEIRCPKCKKTGYRPTECPVSVRLGSIVTFPCTDSPRPPASRHFLDVCPVYSPQDKSQCRARPTLSNA
ncbi:hypothetical protein B0T14DRAFT_315933 [Immersiella caudata]|uniref:Uncharacterized protein n=1 Tax=Immersiella caudata TaxID=314043 RepID=A0AA39WAU5_9PEZI|nr:hypothetical protein B0T14DRAFT_315933 [Immersiella caudata]